MRSILTDTIYLLMTLSLELSFYVTHVCYYFAGVCEMTAVSQSDGVLTITAHATARTARYPRWGISSQRIHSYYTRRPRVMGRAGHRAAAAGEDAAGRL
jgi:hypothetical protein